MQNIFSFLLVATFSIASHLVALTPVERLFTPKDQLVIEREPTPVNLFSIYRQTVSDHSENDKVVMELYDHLEELLQNERIWNSNFSAELVLQAVAYAAEKHEGQKRKYSQVPYVMHPISVIIILLEEGDVKDHFVLAAAALHDTLEDTDASTHHIAYLFS